METRNLLTAKQLAPKLQIGLPRVYELARTKVLPTVRLGRQLRFDWNQITDWIAQGGSEGNVRRSGGAND